MTEISLLKLNFIATLLMVGIIWIVQLVHYPLMANVGIEESASYAQLHQNRISFVVIPPMLLELGTTLLLLKFKLGFHPLHLSAAALLVVIWLSTFLLQVPIHQKLLEQENQHLIPLLVNTNWIRTIGWTARGVLIGLLLQQKMS